MKADNQKLNERLLHVEQKFPLLNMSVRSAASEASARCVSNEISAVFMLQGSAGWKSMCNVRLPYADGQTLPFLQK
eukprot:2035683-Amphidinium_carterae.1